MHTSGWWQASYTQPSTGQRQAAQNTFKTKGDATRWLSSTETDLLRGDPPEPSLGRVHFGEYARDWLAAKTGIRQATRELCEYLLNGHILPTFSAVTVSRIDPAAVRAWHANLIANSGLSQTSAAKAYRLLRQILSAAVDDRLLGLRSSQWDR